MEHPPSVTFTSSTYIATLKFTLKDGVGVLMKALQSILEYECSLDSIQSNLVQGSSDPKLYEFHVQLKTDQLTLTDTLLDALHKNSHVHHAELLHLAPCTEIQVPWFPKTMQDLDTFASKVLAYGTELDADHPGFKDEEYRKRRAVITENALNYRTGQVLPYVEYTEEETKTWTLVFDSLMSLYPLYACREYNTVLQLLLSKGLYTRDRIPQFQELSLFLKSRTGFTLRPVMGLLSPRDFLNGLAFRVFHSTQYIRHPTKPQYTPEPDVIHELLGHVPMFADEDFASFSHALGMASLGASDVEIQHLSNIYWYTVEFGVCLEVEKGPSTLKKNMKAYGAGLLSSAGELMYAMTTDQAEKRPFDIVQASTLKYPITSFQPVYFVTESFQRAKEMVRYFADQLNRPYALRYDPFTESIEMVETKEQICRLVHQLKGSIQTVLTALNKLETRGSLSQLM
ncbi:hypothetical protein HMI54_008210 [Coelomomyces lativittatus]|nr:hypothetical protein HMI54_008210 [Coelomomyces lativittatus]KAJ1504585.1 hypothetical protein HMI55_001952 [Coelomomyces lativittatus]KAJ1507646.1 hypothetical protein HMI56_007688 [Coelomomyces lativittatus]